MRIVLDTNLLVAAARSKRVASHELLSQLPHERFQTAISVPLFLEYRALLLRPENLLRMRLTEHIWLQGDRGRDAGCPAPPSQIPAGGFPAPGSSRRLSHARA